MTPRLTPAGCVACLLAAAGCLSAAERPDSKVIELSPFQVSSDKDVGYVANHTLAGSRLRTNLADVANAISVFTPEFIADLNAFSENDLMRYSAAAVPERTDQTAQVQGINTETGVFQYRIRGQLASRSRNYFGSALLPDTYNSERFEEARGPNAILFGLGGAGGILNTTTKQARFGRAFAQLNFTAGPDALRRVHLDGNITPHERLALRVNALEHTADGWQAHQFSVNRRLALAATVRAHRTTTVRLDAEFGRISQSLGRTYAPFDNVSLWRARGSPLVPGLALADAAAGIGKRAVTQRVTLVGNDGSFRNFQQTVFSQPFANRANSVFLPADWAVMDPSAPWPKRASFPGTGGASYFSQRSLAAVIESEPMKGLFLEFAAVNDIRDQDVYDTTHDVFRVLGEPGQTFRDGALNPWAGRYYVDSRWVLRHERNSGERYRATASYQLDLGALGRHSLAASAARDISGNPRFVGFLVAAGSPFHPQPQQAANQLWTRQYITDPADPAQWAVPDYRRIPSSFTVVMDPGAAPRTLSTAWARNELADQWRHTESHLAALQSSWWRERVITTAGWRYTSQTSFARPTSEVAAPAPLVFTGDARSSSYDFSRISYGVVGKPSRWLSVYYNYSENAQIPGTTVALLPDNGAIPLNSGEGRDYGVMLTLFGGNVFLRAGYFTTASVDQSRASGANNVGERNDRIMDALLAARLISAAQAVRFSGSAHDLFDLATRGYEANLTANLTPGWRLMASLSASDSVETNLLKRSRQAAAQVLPLWRTPAAQALVTNAGVSVAQEIANYESWLAATTAVEDQGTVGHREVEFRAFTRYDFRQGKLKGVFFGGGLSYGSAPVIGRSTAGQLLLAPVRREADLLLGYKTRLPVWLGRAAADVQFNANNLLQESPYTLLRRDPDGQNFRAVLNPPPTYSLSLRLGF